MKGELFAGAKMLLGRKQLLCIGAGLVFGAAAQAGQEINRSPDRLVRPDYGEEETHQILVEGLIETEEVSLEIPLGAREYRKEEAIHIYEEILEELPDQILGENASLMEVRGDLELPEEVPEYGVSLK